jgi:hypothetical protein
MLTAHARFALASATFALCGACTLLSAAEPVTFTQDVAPIFQAKCDECHHPGTAAPMSLETYAETRPWAKAIRERVVTRNMPPWHLDKTVGIQHFQNDRSLTDQQIDIVSRWVDAGAPEGNPARDGNSDGMPAPQKWATNYLTHLDMLSYGHAKRAIPIYR